MIIQLTNKCNLACTHCMYECSPLKNDFMDLQTLKKAIVIANRSAVNLLVSGGEITTHHNFINMIKYISKKFKGSVITLLSNGMIFDNEETRNEVLSLMEKDHRILVQITDDRRFYPKRDIFKIHSHRINYVDRIISLHDLGRAKNLDRSKLDIDYEAKGPTCFNIRSLFTHFDDFTLALNYLEINGKYCSMKINPKGDLIIGECGQVKISNINEEDWYPKANENFKKNIIPCDKCGMWSKMKDVTAKLHLMNNACKYDK